ncbi:MAG: Hpt domain-containing protein [Lachnospiraceae bacterium]|nr:Hpt domain-containing protein [Lachnospiraceae bacterium]
MRTELEQLKQAGCDIDGALERFLQDEEFYLECYEQVMADENFEGLGDALKAHNVEQAFDCAHALKGVIANMGLTPVFNQLAKIVEPLRAGKDEGLLEPYQKLLDIREEFRKLI